MKLAVLHSVSLYLCFGISILFQAHLQAIQNISTDTCAWHQLSYNAEHLMSKARSLEAKYHQKYDAYLALLGQPSDIVAAIQKEPIESPHITCAQIQLRASFPLLAFHDALKGSLIALQDMLDRLATCDTGERNPERIRAERNERREALSTLVHELKLLQTILVSTAEYQQQEKEFKESVYRQR